MDDKNKLVLEEKKEPTPTDSVSKNLNEHLQQNIDSHQKKKLDLKTLMTYVAMVLIIIGCIVLIYVFLDKNDANPFKKTTTTTTYGAKTVEASKEVYSQATAVSITTTSSNTGKLIERGTTSPENTTTRTTFHTVNRS